MQQMRRRAQSLIKHDQRRRQWGFGCTNWAKWQFIDGTCRCCVSEQRMAHRRDVVACLTATDHGSPTYIQQTHTATDMLADNPYTSTTNWLRFTNPRQTNTHQLICSLLFLTLQQRIDCGSPTHAKQTHTNWCACWWFKGKGSQHSVTDRRVPKLIPVLGSQPAGDVSHKHADNLHFNNDQQ